MLLTSAIKVIVGWFVLMLIGTNLVGLVVRGLVPNHAVDKLENEAHPLIQDKISKGKKANKFLTLLFAVIAILFLFMLFYFFNLGVMVAALMLMVSRVPDLLWEMEIGTKITKKNTPKGGVYTIGTILNYGALFVLWLSM